MDMSVMKPDMEITGGREELEVVIDTAAIMSFFQESQDSAPTRPRKHGAHRRHIRVAAELNTARRRRASPSRRCVCGSCYTCRENARWERIFQEKFADPTYYDRRTVSFRSPLHIG
jgi:hypothetical protein